MLLPHYAKKAFFNFVGYVGVYFIAGARDERLLHDVATAQPVFGSPSGGVKFTF